jgi:hypothetical protein
VHEQEGHAEHGRREAGELVEVIAARICLNCVPRVSFFELPISARPHSSTSGTPLSSLPV